VNNLAIAGVFLNCVAAIAIAAQEDMAGFYFTIVEACAVLSVIGAGLVVSGRKKPGAILIILGSALLVPFGLVGIFGGRKILAELKPEVFDRSPDSAPPALPASTVRPTPPASTGNDGKLGVQILGLVIVGVAVHVLVNGYFHMVNINRLMQGLFPQKYVAKFLYNLITFTAMVAANIWGIVLLRRNALKVGGYLLIAANALYLADRTLSIIANNLPILHYRVFLMFVPSIMAIAGGFLTLKSFKDQSHPS